MTDLGMSDLGAIPVLRFESLDSTNEEVLRRLAAGERPPFWVIAKEQTKGRGRSGRRWHSPCGNLYATLVIETAVSAATATELSFVAGLAVHDAAAVHLPLQDRARLRLKWPNDLMFGSAKLAGILLESLGAAKGHGLTVLLGMGINVAFAPPDPERQVACLGLPAADVERVFAALAAALETWLSLWDEGRGFAAIRQSWLERALALDEPITVNLNGSQIRGRFRGIDAAGALRLETKPGDIILVTAGDIYTDALV